MLKLKQSNPALALGSYANLSNDNNKVFSFLRTYQQHQVLVVVNLSNELQTASLANHYQNNKLLYGSTKLNQQLITLSPYQLAVFEVN